MDTAGEKLLSGSGSRSFNPQTLLNPSKSIR